MLRGFMASGVRPVRTRVQALLKSFDPRVLQRTRQRVDDLRDSTREPRRALDLIEIRTEQLMQL